MLLKTENMIQQQKKIHFLTVPVYITDLYITVSHDKAEIYLIIVTKGRLSRILF